MQLVLLNDKCRKCTNKDRKPIIQSNPIDREIILDSEDYSNCDIFQEMLRISGFQAQL